MYTKKRHYLNGLELSVFFIILLSIIIALTTFSVEKVNAEILQSSDEENLPLITAECCIEFSNSINEEDSSKILEDQKQCASDRMTMQSYTEEEAFALAKIISAEAGGVNDDYWQQLVGYVVMNRVASDMYPDTIEGVLYDQYSPYATTSKERYETDFVTDRAMQNAKIVLTNFYTNNIPVPQNLVYQAEFEQGETFLHIGNTYFGLEPSLPAE